MRDPRVRKMAQLLLGYSTKVEAGDIVYIEQKGRMSQDLVLELVSVASEMGAIPFVFDLSGELLRRMLLNMDEEQLKVFAKQHLEMMKLAKVFISVRGDNHAFPLSDVPKSKTDMWNELFWVPVHIQERASSTRWVVVRYPNDSMADGASMAQEPFADFYFNACLTDYGRMSKAMDPLVALMDRTDKVQIVGPGTDLTFSIKGIPAVKCDGEKNIPDGEVYTAPVIDSADGVITYNAPSLFEGMLYSGVCFRIQAGKIVKATCSGGDVVRLNAILDREGSRMFGEFALGVNPDISHPMRDTLFDEKIYGSFHFTVGNAYDNADNGNKAKIHWDLISIQTPEHGGGSIFFDDRLIRQDGDFVIEELLGLNRAA